MTSEMVSFESRHFSAGLDGRRTLQAMLPVETAFDLAKVLDWASDNGVVGEPRERAFGLAKRLRSYNVPAYIVDTDDEQAVRQIFDRMNTFGRRMKRSEVFDAIHSTSDRDGPRRLSWVGAISTELGFGELSEQLVLYGILATRGTDVLRDFHKEFEDDSDKQDSFVSARETLGRVIRFLRDRASIPHAMLVPHQHLFVTLVRFFHLYPDPEQQTLILLRRWFWRAALLGPNLRGGTTGTLRQSVGAIVSGTEFEGITGLLNMTTVEAATPQLPRANSIRLSTADGRMVVAALFSISPLSPYDLEHISPDDLLGENRVPFPSLLEKSRLSKHAAVAGNRLLYREDDSTTLPFLETAELLSDADHELLLASHLIDSTFRELANSQQPERAFSRRAGLITTLVRNFVQSRAEWDLLPRPSIAALLAKNEDDEDDGSIN